MNADESSVFDQPTAIALGPTADGEPAADSPPRWATRLAEQQAARDAEPIVLTEFDEEIDLTPQPSRHHPSASEIAHRAAEKVKHLPEHMHAPTFEGRPLLAWAVTAVVCALTLFAGFVASRPPPPPLEVLPQTFADHIGANTRPGDSVLTCVGQDLAERELTDTRWATTSPADQIAVWEAWLGCDTKVASWPLAANHLALPLSPHKHDCMATEMLTVAGADRLAAVDLTASSDVWSTTEFTELTVEALDNCRVDVEVAISNALETLGATEVRADCVAAHVTGNARVAEMLELMPFSGPDDARLVALAPTCL